MNDRQPWECPSCGYRLASVRLPVRCGRCASAGTKDVETASLRYRLDRLAECTNRRELLGRERCNSCGARGLEIDVFACAIHDRAFDSSVGSLSTATSCRRCCAAGEGFTLPEASPPAAP